MKLELIITDSQYRRLRETADLRKYLYKDMSRHKRLGGGSFGVAYTTKSRHVALKITGDDNEARIAALLSQLQRRRGKLGEAVRKAFVRFHAVAEFQESPYDAFAILREWSDGKVLGEGSESWNWRGWSTRLDGLADALRSCLSNYTSQVDRATIPFIRAQGTEDELARILSLQEHVLLEGASSKSSSVRQIVKALSMARSQLRKKVKWSAQFAPELTPLLTAMSLLADREGVYLVDVRGGNCVLEEKRGRAPVVRCFDPEALVLGRSERHLRRRLPIYQIK